MDSSNSVGEENFQRSLKFISKIIRNLEFASGKSRVALITFNDEARTIFSLQTYSNKKEILDVIARTDFTVGGAFTAGALRMMREEIFDTDRGDRSTAPNRCIFITDGVSNILPQETIPEAKQAKSAQIHITAIGVGLTDQSELRGIASDELSVFTVERYSQLGDLSDAVLDRLCAHEPDSSNLLMHDSPLSYTGKRTDNCKS